MTFISELERAAEFFNAGDIDSLVGFYADEAVITTPVMTMHGRDGFRAHWVQERGAFPDAHMTQGVSIEQDNITASEFTWSGTHTGPMILPDGTEVAATGKHVELRCMELLRWGDDGKVIVHNMYWDSVAFLTQLGLMPSGAAA